MKRFLTYLVCLIGSAAALFTFAEPVEAKDYWIDSAVFDVQLNRDGSAEITEDWTLTFEGGTYSRYYKDVHTRVSEVESFSQLSVEEVQVDGVSCRETTDTEGRPEYHYSVIESGEDIELAAYFRFDQGSHHIVFKYRLDDVVKNWGDEAAAFCYRYLGDEFDTNVRELELRVTAPENCTRADWDVRFADNLTVMDSNDLQIVLAGSNRTGMIKVKLWMDPDAFDGLTLVDPDSADKEPLGFWGKLLRGIGVIAGVFVVWVVVGVAKESKRHKKMREEHRADPTRFSALIHHLPGQIPLSEIMCLYYAPQDQRIFFCLLLDLIRRGVLLPKTREQGMASPECPEVEFGVTYIYGLAEYERQLLETLAMTPEPTVISDQQINSFLLEDAKKQSDAMKAIVKMVRASAENSKKRLAVQRGVKSAEVASEVEYLRTILESRDETNMYPDIYDILYVRWNDFRDRLDPAILTEMILRYGWSLGKGKADEIHLRTEQPAGDEQAWENVAQYAKLRGMESYLVESEIYYNEDSSFPVVGGDSGICVDDLRLLDIDRISEYFSGVVDRMEEQFNSAASSSSDSGSSCSSCSSCSGCGGGGAD